MANVYLRYAPYALAAFFLCSPPFLIVRAHYVTQALVQKATFELRSNDSLEYDLVGHLIVKQNVTGRESHEYIRQVYQNERKSSTFKIWTEQRYAREKKLVHALFCDQSLEIKIGLAVNWVNRLLQHPSFAFHDGSRPLSGYPRFVELQEYYCRGMPQAGFFDR